MEGGEGWRRGRWIRGSAFRTDRRAFRHWCVFRRDFLSTCHLGRRTLPLKTRVRFAHPTVPIDFFDAKRK